MMVPAPAAAASRASATASSSSTRVQPSTATRPSEASTPTMIRSSKRRHTSPRKAGSSAARVPTMAQRAPASSTVSTWATSRRPPSGKGYLKGSQKALSYLPMRHTDFIYSVVGEELGLIGSLTVVLLYVVVIARGYRLAV